MDEHIFVSSVNEGLFSFFFFWGMRVVDNLNAVSSVLTIVGTDQIVQFPGALGKTINLILIKQKITEELI